MGLFSLSSNAWYASKVQTCMTYDYQGIYESIYGDMPFHKAINELGYSFDKFTEFTTECRKQKIVPELCAIRCFKQIVEQLSSEAFSEECRTLYGSLPGWLERLVDQALPIRLTQTPAICSVGHRDGHGHPPARRSGFSPVAA